MTPHRRTQPRTHHRKHHCIHQGTRRATVGSVLLVGLILGAALLNPHPVLSQGEGAEAAPAAETLPTLQPMDVFDLEWAADPRISPDGSRIVYVRGSMDVMEDHRRAHLWTISADGSDHRPLTFGEQDASSPRWSPGGDRLLFLAEVEGTRQLWIHWLDRHHSAPITRLTRGPSNPAWSPDGRWIAFLMPVPYETEPFVQPPKPPEGAQWAQPPRVIERLTYRADGSGYLPASYDQLFVVSAEGGTPRQLTRGPYPISGAPAWSADGRHLVIASNRQEDWERDPRDSELWRVSVTDGALEPLTDRQGPDQAPAVSPDGSKIAYLGFTDREQGYQVTRLSVLDLKSGASRVLTAHLDRSVSDPRWAADGSGIFVQSTDHGVGRILFVGLDGTVRRVASSVGGLSLGRPYGGGDYSVSRDGRVVFTLSDPHHPADLAVVDGVPGEEGLSGDAEDGRSRRLTRLNEDLLGHRELATVEEITFPSSHDGRTIQGWLVKPPGFDPEARYPLILEIHGGPFADYGPRFAAEIQLYAAAGYGVLYVNPRGSTSYGEEFGNLIHHAYPGHDYDDLMSGVDAVLARGWVDPERLYVTGGSGGGVLSAWIVGSTDRFRAAVVAKPVINWASFVLTADFYGFFAKDYWFPALPWEDPQHYWQRSPLSRVGNVTTPTMVLTGEEDYRTPMSESEQFYQALQLRGVDTLLVRIPGASHGIARRPSQLITKVQHVLGWFDKYGGGD